MKAKDYSAFIKDLSDFLQKSGADQTAQAWQQFLPLFSANPETTISQLTKLIAKEKPDPTIPGIKVSKIIALTPSLIALFKARAKQAFITDTQNIAKALHPHQDVSITALVKATQHTLQAVEQKKQATKYLKEQKAKEEAEKVSHYVSRLLEALGNAETFPLLVEEIKGKTAKLPVSTIKKIAHEFSKRPVSQISNKTKAIEAIEYRHNALMVGRAKSEATGDRTAA